jgi:hypothetical protein
LHDELSTLKGLLSCNGYPGDFIDNAICKFLNSKVQPEPKPITAKKCPLVFKLPYMGKISFTIRRRLVGMLSDVYSAVDVRFIFTSANRISSMFRFKDVVPFALRSGVIYKFSCGSCHATYIGKTSRHIHTRICEHAGVSHLTGRPTRSVRYSAVHSHCLPCSGLACSPDDFSILGSINNNERDLLILESLFISLQKPALNAQLTSFPLLLF